MLDAQRVLVVQTAFLGDVILTLPLVQVLRRVAPTAEIDLLVVPRTAELLHNHPDIHETLIFDKRGVNAGIRGFIGKTKEIRRRGYYCALIPHRSVRSALLAWAARIPIRIGFDSSSGKMFLTTRVRYDDTIHEIERNLLLLGGLGIRWDGKEYPKLYPSKSDQEVVDRLVDDSGKGVHDSLLAMAPGTVWNTKRWMAERFAALAGMLAREGVHVVLIGGPEDVDLCNTIVREAAVP